MCTTWNEPNHPSFLSRSGCATADGSWRPMSPHVYRAMHNAAYDAIKRVSRRQPGAGRRHGSASAPRCPGKGGVPPLEVRPHAGLRRRQAASPLQGARVRGLPPLKADGWAHHPYSRYTTPGTSDPDADDVPIADVGRLGGPARASCASAAASLSSSRSTRPSTATRPSQDDPYQPFNREQQAAFIGWSTFLAWKDPDTRMFAQFLLRDIDPAESGRKRGTRAYYRDWQSGLYTADGNAKPAVQAFKLPFWAQTPGRCDQQAVLLFGEVRPGTRPAGRARRAPGPGDRRLAPVQTYGPVV